MNTAATSHFATVNGLKFHYVEWGRDDATPIIMLHGLRAYAHWFDDFAEVAKHDFRLIAIDQRGRGGTDWANDGDYSRDAYVNDLEAFADVMGFEKFILVGHSMGGLNSLHFTAKHPQRVSALINIDIGPDIPADGMERLGKELNQTPARFESWTEAEAFINKRHPTASLENRETRKRWMFREVIDGSIDWRIDPTIFDPKMGLEPPEQIWSAIDRIGCSTLIIRGAQSDVFSAECCAEMVKRIDDCHSVEIANSGHMVLEDNPEAFNLEALEFLKKFHA